LGLHPDEVESPAVLQKMIQAGVRNKSYDQASLELKESAELEIHAKKIERAVGRIGGERVRQRDEGVAAWQTLPLPQQQGTGLQPKAPQVAVAEFDCGRMLIRERPKKRRDQPRPATDAGQVSEASLPDAVQAGAQELAEVLVEAQSMLPGAESESEASPAEDTVPGDKNTAPEECRSRFWRDDKVGVLQTMHSQEHAADPCPHIPESFVDQRRILKLVRELGGQAAGVEQTRKSTAETGQEADDPPHERERPGAPVPLVRTVVASRARSVVFGAILAAAAWARGFAAAGRKAFLADGAAMNWTLWRQFFSHYIPILDFIHALQYVFAAAFAGRSSAEGWPVYCRWIQAVWSGEVQTVIVELRERLAALGPPPADAPASDPRKIVATTLGYLETHQQRMDYARYRRLGLPIMSSYVESTVKQINFRVKGTEKFWSERGAEAILQLRADYLSETRPLDAFWQRRQCEATGQRSYRRAA
jgi:hypothetical protein